MNPDQISSICTFKSSLHQEADLCVWTRVKILLPSGFQMALASKDLESDERGGRNECIIPFLSPCGVTLIWLWPHLQSLLRKGITIWLFSFWASIAASSPPPSDSKGAQSPAATSSSLLHWSYGFQDHSFIVLINKLSLNNSVSAFTVFPVSCWDAAESTTFWREKSESKKRLLILLHPLRVSTGTHLN